MEMSENLYHIPPHLAIQFSGNWIRSQKGKWLNMNLMYCLSVQGQSIISESDDSILNIGEFNSDEQAQIVLDDLLNAIVFFK